MQSQTLRLTSTPLLVRILPLALDVSPRLANPTVPKGRNAALMAAEGLVVLAVVLSPSARQAVSVSNLLDQALRLARATTLSISLMSLAQVRLRVTVSRPMSASLAQMANSSFNPSQIKPDSSQRKQRTKLRFRPEASLCE